MSSLSSTNVTSIVRSARSSGLRQWSQVTTGGADPSNPTPDVQLNFVLRSGTNRWRASGRYYYENAKETDFVPGLMHVNLGGYHVKDIEFTCAFDINKTKVGKDLAQAIWADPNAARR